MYVLQEDKQESEGWDLFLTRCDAAMSGAGGGRGRRARLGARVAFTVACLFRC